MQVRLKSPVLWAAVAALVAFVTKEWMGLEIPKWDIFVELMMSVLVTLGILNNPTDKEKF